MDSSELNPSYVKLENEQSEKYIDVVNSNSENDLDVSLDYESRDEMNNYPQRIDMTCTPNETTSEFNKNFKEECIRELKDDVMLQTLVDNLDVEGNLNDFMMLIKQLASGELPANNIVLLLLLDRVRFQAADNTVGMRYRSVTKLFWSVVYRLCKGVGLKFFGGEKNRGQVATRSSKKKSLFPYKVKNKFHSTR